MIEDNMRLGIIEDNEKLRNNYVDFFSLFPNYSLIFSLSNLDEIIRKNNPLNLPVPDIILLDINLPGTSGVDGIQLLKQLYPKVIIIMLTANDDSEILIKAIENGASGYLVKGISLHQIKIYIENYITTGTAITPNVAVKLFEHINKTSKKKTTILKPLTKREKELASCIVDGLTHKEIGAKLKIQASTVNHHLKSIFIKLNVNSKLELISKFHNS